MRSVDFLVSLAKTQPPDLLALRFNPRQQVFLEPFLLSSLKQKLPELSLDSLKHITRDCFLGKTTLGEIGSCIQGKLELCHEEVVEYLYRLIVDALEQSPQAFVEQKDFQLRYALQDHLPPLTLARLQNSNVFNFFDAIICINATKDELRRKAMSERFQRLGIAERVVRFPAIMTPNSHHIGCTLSHRAIVSMAHEQGLSNILVFEDDALALAELEPLLQRSLAQLKERPWKLFYLGAHLWDSSDRKVDGCDAILSAKLATTTHAVAYHQSAYEQILCEIPGSVIEMIGWCERNRAIDQYLAVSLTESFVANPNLFVQAQSLPLEDERRRVLYT